MTARALLVLGIALITAVPRPVRDLEPQACILNDRAQGLSLAQAQEDCLIRLQKDGNAGTLCSLLHEQGRT